MLGKSHLLVGLTGGIVVDSLFHVTGSPLTLATAVPLTLLVKKAVYYFFVGFGALLPDIDNARSSMGRKLGWVSKEILHVAGDALTEGGVPLFWPSHKRYGFPPNPHWRFRTGTWPEPVIVYSFMLLVGIGIYMYIIHI